MSATVTRTEVLNLYKKLLVYSKNLTYTDPSYFRRRITKEFQQNKELTNAEDITFAFKVRNLVFKIL